MFRIFGINLKYTSSVFFSFHLFFSFCFVWHFQFISYLRQYISHSCLLLNLFHNDLHNYIIIIIIILFLRHLCDILFIFLQHMPFLLVSFSNIVVVSFLFMNIFNRSINCIITDTFLNIVRTKSLVTIIIRYMILIFKVYY